MPNLAFGTPNTKNGALWDVPNLKKYATPLQYCLKYETVWTTIAKLNIIILLRFSLSPSTNISLFVFSLCHSQTLSHFFSLCHSLSFPSPPCLRKLLKITLQSSLPIFPIIVTDLTASFSTTCRQSCSLILQPSPPTSTALTADLQISLNQVVGVRFGMGFDMGFGSAFWISAVWVVGRGFGLVGLGF